MAKATNDNDAHLLILSLRKAYAATPTTLKLQYTSTTLSLSFFPNIDCFSILLTLLLLTIAQLIDLYVLYAVVTALIQVVYMAIVGSFPFNSFLSGILSCVGTAVLAVCLHIQVNKDNKEFKDLPPERAFADFVLCNLVLHLVIMNFLG